ncbi:MAG: ceramidase domain-containing protein [Sulfurifustis sp.]
MASDEPAAAVRGRAVARPRRARVAALLIVPLLALVAVLTLPPIAQDLRYHAFADARTVLGIANFANVVSNLPFLLVGAFGLALCLGARRPTAWRSWATFFAGVAIVCFGSGYYHLAPSNDSLVWDRLPMTLAFMGLFVALVSEHVEEAHERYWLGPALLAGFASVAWWHYADDLRLYFWIQGAPLLVVVAALALFPARYTHRRYLLYGLGLYAAAKIAELDDLALFQWSGMVMSGHSLKHLLAAASAACVYVMLCRRSPVSDSINRRAA